MSDFKKEFRKQTQGMFIGLAVTAPIMLVLSVLLVYAEVPFYFNMIICVMVGLVTFFIFHFFYGMIQKKKAEKRESKKGKDPFAD